MEHKLEEYVVAFIDILGSSKKIKENGEKSLNTVHDVYQNAMARCEALFDNESINNLKPKIRIFSDNIVVAVPTNQNGDFSAFIAVAILSGLIQHEFLQYKYLVRGGITIGDFFVDDTMLWGKALLDAYYIENNVSVYPRIVVHPETVAKLHLATNEKRQKWIQQDADGLFFVDYMQKTAFKDFYIELLIHRLNECKELLEEATDIKSKQKVLWHNTYLSSKLDIYSPEYNEILKQKIKKLEAKTKEIESHQ